MEFPEDLKYSKEHEWVLIEGDLATIGITDFAQDQLGDIVFVELPSVGDTLTKDAPFGVVESVKAVSDVYAPISGTVVEINDDLPDHPEILNEDCYSDGWIVKVRITEPSELASLMDAAGYEKYTAEAAD